MSLIFIVGDIFKIENKEYRLRYISQHSICWLEPVLKRDSVNCVTGGLNKTYLYDDLEQLEYIDECY